MSFSDTTIRYFPPKNEDPDKPRPHVAYITCYIGNGRSIDKIIADITDAIDPNYRIFVGKVIIGI